MTRTEADREDYVRDALGGALDGEPLVAAQWCRPGGSTEKGHEGFGRKLGRLFGGGNDDGLRDMNILAAPETDLTSVTLPDGRAVEFPRGPEVQRPIEHVNRR